MTIYLLLGKDEQRKTCAVEELQWAESGEVVVVSKVIYSPVPTKVGQRVDVRIEDLWYEDKEVLCSGGIQIYANDMRAEVGGPGAAK